MSTTSKKPKTLSASRLTKLVYKHATLAQPAENTSGTSRHICKGNSELDAVPDQHNVLSDETLTAESYQRCQLCKRRTNLFSFIIVYWANKKLILFS